MPSPIHLLTHANDLPASTVACGAADASLGSFDRERVTCASCLRACHCGPDVRLCPACRTYNAQHRGQPTTLPERPAGRPSGPYRKGFGPRRRAVP
jgi:hypothetical protein